MLATRARWKLIDGTIEIAVLQHAPRRSWSFAAITLVHLIVGTHAAELHRLRAHKYVDKR